ncbi:hypothetical protein [Nocardiopsis sp. YSL2]|uniref:hypothetical protein n=1 Tax=Nocardiopsis sp. YSL2 TaxID=2939492 RepID=UPI0026F453A8|nr:hypothetical protein [Nocardiopsis sp. YSL2]
MAELAAFLPFADIGLVGIFGSAVAYVLYALITGRLMPAATHDRIVASRDAQLQQMRELYLAERERGDLLAAQTASLTEAAKTSASAIDALRDVATSSPPPEEGDDR